MQSLFQLHNAVVRREGKEILSIGSFTLNHGENIALLGPNGAGKSTFIHLLTREVFPLYKEEPPVLFKGKDRATLEEIKKKSWNCIINYAGPNYRSSSLC